MRLAGDAQKVCQLSIECPLDSALGACINRMWTFGARRLSDLLCFFSEIDIQRVHCFDEMRYVKRLRDTFKRLEGSFSTEETKISEKELELQTYH